MPQVRAKVALRSEQACDAITIPVTTAARQENSSKSFRILMAIGATPMQHDPRSASQYLDQKVMDDRMN